MNTLMLALFGPLSGLECRRALAGNWLLLIRGLACLPVLAILMLVIWIWWLGQKFSPGYDPTGLLLGATATIMSLYIAAALLLSPAMLSGTLAGEKESGTLGLLLIARVSSHEIVASRLAGRMCQIAVVLAGGLPGLVLIAGLCGLGWKIFALLALPGAVALGAGGMALFASAVARRGRDALLSVYLSGLCLVLGVGFGAGFLPAAIGDWLLPMDPFQSMLGLIYRDEVRLILISIAFWTTLGGVGLIAATWQLRPAYERHIAGGSSRKTNVRSGRVPPIGDNPMLWKELYIERAKTFGKFGRWLGFALVLFLVGSSVILAGFTAWYEFAEPNQQRAERCRSLMHWIVGYTAMVVGWLIQWAIGLRAAATIATERQQATWDSLLTSPLEGREIVWGKLWGSLYAMRGLVAAVLLAWTLALLCEAMPVEDYLTVLANTLIAGAFMAAVGVWLSLATHTSARAMTLTIGIWLGAVAATPVAAVILVGLLTAAIAIVWAGGTWYGFAPAGSSPPYPMTFQTAYTLARLLLYLALASLMTWLCWLRFDRISGRGCEGLVLMSIPVFPTPRPVPPLPPPAEPVIATPIP